jgi:hypothetical protein
VLDAAKYGEGREYACLRRRLPQLGVPVGNPENRLRWPSSVVLLNEFHDRPANVIDAEEDEEVCQVWSPPPMSALTDCSTLLPFPK